MKSEVKMDIDIAIKIKNKIRESYNKIAEYEDEMLELLKNNKTDKELINFIYWDTDITFSDVKQVLNVSEAKILKMIKPKTILLQCPECLEFWEAVIKNRTDRKNYLLKNINRECAICKKNIIERYRNQILNIENEWWRRGLDEKKDN